MKRLLVLADTHGNRNAVDRVLKEAGEVDAVIHLGDMVRDARYLRGKGLTVYSVKGNCDFNEEAQTEMLLQMAGKRIFLTHGHRYGVKYALDRLVYRAAELRADACFYGHTHMPQNEYVEGILFLNPGSIAEPRFTGATFAVVEIENGDLRVSLLPL